MALLPMPTLNTYVDPYHIKNSPSRLAGIDEETETALRIFGCELIQEAGIMLKLSVISLRPQVTMATGQVLFHRYYCRKSFREYDVKSMAFASIFLSAKVEEAPKRIRDIINVQYHLTQKHDGVAKPDPIDPSKQIFYDLKNDLIKNERMILRELGFMVYVELPHKYVPNYVGVLKLGNEITQQAWNYTNDSLRTNVCVRYKPGQIATAAIFMAARALKIRLPGPPHPWWELFDCRVDVDVDRNIDEICIAVASLYKRPKAIYIDVNTIPLPVPVTPPRILLSPVRSTTPSKTPPHSTNGTNGSHKENGTSTNPKTIPSTSPSSPPSPSSSSRHSRRDRDSKSRSGREKQRDSRDRDRDRDRSHKSDRDRDREYRSRDKDREKDRDREKDKGREKDKDRDKDRDKDKDRDRDKVRDRGDRDRDRRDDRVDRYRPSSASSSHRRSPYSR